MAIFYTDETALEFWRWHNAIRSTLERPKRARLDRLPAAAPTPTEAQTAAQAFHKTDDPIHVLIPTPSSKRRSPDIEYSYFKGDLPAGSAYSLGRGTYIASPEFAFVLMARKLDLVDSILLGCELTGSYVKIGDMTSTHSKSVAPLTTTTKLDHFVSHASNVRGIKQARKAVKHICENAASPMEAEIATVLTLPMRFGGYGLPKPCLNYRLDIDDDLLEQFRRPSITVDFMWPDASFGMEYESNEWHADNEKFIRDSIRRNDARYADFDLMTLTFEEYDSLASMDRIATSICRKILHRQQHVPSDYTTRKLMLRTKLKDIRREDMLRSNSQSYGIV